MSAALRFCLVTTFYPPYHFGGDGVFVYRLARALAARGHAVDVVHSIDAFQLAGTAPHEGFAESPGVSRLPLRTPLPLLSSLASHQLGSPGPYRHRLREILAPGRYDVIHFHNVSLVGGPEVLRYGDGVKLYTAHEYWLDAPLTCCSSSIARRATPRNACAVRCAHAARRSFGGRQRA